MNICPICGKEMKQGVLREKDGVPYWICLTCAQKKVKKMINCKTCVYHNACSYDVDDCEMYIPVPDV